MERILASGQRKLALLTAAMAFVCTAGAFDSAEWLEKRELFAREAERLMAVYAACKAKALTPAEDVTVPVETFEDGSVKVVIYAKRAQYFLDSGLVYAEDVTIRKFRQDGTVDGLIEAKSCVFDRQSKSGWADGRAKVEHGKTTFEGEGVFFSSPEAYVRVFHHSVIESKDLKFGGVTL